MKPQTSILLGVAGMLTVGLTGCALLNRKPPLNAARHIDLSSYMGAWRVIATTDNPAERHFADAVETYTQGTDNEILVHFRWRERDLTAPPKTHDFTGHVVDTRSNAEWKMKVVPPLRAAYVILAVGEKYEWAVVGHPSRKFGWILARAPQIDGRTYDRALGILRQNGYSAQFIRVKQPH